MMGWLYGSPIDPVEMGGVIRFWIFWRPGAFFTYGHYVTFMVEGINVQ
jgi:hypothetical protein